MVYRATAVASLALLAWALYWTTRIAYADWLFVQGDAASVRQAMRLGPGNAEYASALARAEPDGAPETLHDAIARNPLDGGLRLELGLAEEQRGNLVSAEKDLLEAIRLDRGFGPRAALADFYFHRHDAEKFWPAVKEALTWSYGDASAQFRQCWALSSDPAAILERAIPDRPAVLRLYLDFLLSEGRLDAAVPVAGRVLANGDREAAPTLLNYCDRMLDQWRGEEALAVWQALVERNWLTETGRGFDWRVSAGQGIRVERVGQGWRIEFSGTEAESSEILSRFVPLLPGRRYVTTMRAPADSGLWWQVLVADGHDLLGGGTAFQAPENARLGRFVLVYRRVPGTVRLQGAVDVREFGLQVDDR